jgi:hypothetical protein
MITWDPTYFDDFWTLPGYLGADPTPSLLAAKVQHKTRILRLVRPGDAAPLGLPIPMAMRGQENVEDVPLAYELEDTPEVDLTGASLEFTGGKASGHHVLISGRRANLLTTGIGQEQFEHLRQVAVGDEVLVDNTRYLAFQTYHRHQVPPDEYPEWDQFRAAGQPIYPQRPELLGPRYQRNNGTGLKSGRFAGKVIVVQSLFDEIAYPQQAAWYHRRVKSWLGPATDDQYRIWFTDHAMHQDPAVMPRVDITPHRCTHIINFRGVLEQALRDLAAWVERGIAPPLSTAYELVDGQVQVPTTAAARRGIQPVVALTANGGERAQVAVGEPVQLSALAEVPPMAGTIIAAAWDFEGAGDFPVTVPIDNEAASYVAKTITASHAFSAPGVYFPALRVTSHRFGEVDSPHGRIHNLGRVRVVVH